MDVMIGIMNSVSGTSTNVEGYTLFAILSKEIEQGNNIKLSLKDCTPMSSSFLNSSFGELVEKFGIDKVKHYIRLIHYRPSQAERIKKFLNMLNNHHR